MKHLLEMAAIAGLAVALLVLAAPGSLLAQEPIELPADERMEMTAPPGGETLGMPSLRELLAADKDAAEDPYAADASAATRGLADRVTYRVYKWQRGTTLFISNYTVGQYCGDIDGCTLRMGMYNWDNTGRVASRESLLYYNNGNRVWRASRSDAAGTDWNGSTQHVMNAWACYFTDGAYSSWNDLGDPNAGFGLLSWHQYNAECFLTIID